VPFSQKALDAHEPHWTPPRPQANWAPPPWQIPFWSQQPPQLAGEQSATVHAPPLQLPFGPQFWHWLPPVPQAFWLSPPMHMLPRQHPLQFCAPHGVATHCCAFGSHTAPTDVQLSQTWPPEPQVLSCVPAAHRKPPMPSDWQQPVGQVVALQAACGVSQTWRVGSHCWNPADGQFAHASPPVPHSVAWVPGWQVPVVSQQPVVQLLALHAGGGAVQVCVDAAQVDPLAQAAQARPLAPHAAVAVPGWQVSFESQHPVGHVEALHVGSATTSALASRKYPWSRSERPQPPSTNASAANSSAYICPVVGAAPVPQSAQPPEVVEQALTPSPAAAEAPTAARKPRLDRRPMDDLGRLLLG